MIFFEKLYSEGVSLGSWDDGPLNQNHAVIKQMIFDDLNRFCQTPATSFSMFGPSVKALFNIFVYLFVGLAFGILNLRLDSNFFTNNGGRLL